MLGNSYGYELSEWKNENSTRIFGQEAAGMVKVLLFAAWKTTNKRFIYLFIYFTLLCHGHKGHELWKWSAQMTDTGCHYDQQRTSDVS